MTLFLGPRTILPVLISCAVLALGVRIGDAWEGLSTGRIFAPGDKLSLASFAAAKAESTPPEPPAKSAPPEKAAQAEPADPSRTKEEAEPTAGEMGLASQLSSRREQLDQRSGALDQREAILKITEQRVDQKVKEMETLRAQLLTLLNQASAQQQVQLDNLVKIYETMKPKEAAKIFESLEMPVLLGVVQKMKPARTASVMAEMAPEKAKELTVALTKQDQLPQIK